VSRFIIKQPNIVRDNLIKEPSIKSNTMSVSPPRRMNSGKRKRKSG
jgi:hypothetical protein